jgi:hypothetical protein
LLSSSGLSLCEAKNSKKSIRSPVKQGHLSAPDDRPWEDRIQADYCLFRPGDRRSARRTPGRTRRKRSGSARDRE